MLTRTFCGKMCGASCGIIVTTEEGRIVKVEGDPEYPPTKGYFCVKGKAITELIYHPDRLTNPLRRVGPRGSGQWEEITAGEAVSHIADKLRNVIREHGSESVAFHMGAHRNDLIGEFMQRLGKTLGTPNFATVDNVCSKARSLADKYTFGQKCFPDYNHPSECLIVWGRNSLDTGGESRMDIIRQAREHGTKILVIDPRETSITRLAHQWVKPRPGSDGYLGLALLKTIIEEGLHDREFVERYTIGFDKLREMLGSYTFEELEKETWISVDEMKKFARTYATSKPAAIQTGNPLDQTPNSYQTCRLISILRAVTGNLDVPGGEVFANGVPFVNITEVEDMSRRPMIGSEFKVAASIGIAPSQDVLRAASTGDPYPIKASLIFGSNPLTTYANTEGVYKAIMNLDLIVTAEFFMTPTAKYSDIILPVAANHEYDDFSPKFGHIVARPKIIDPLGECRADIQWMNLIARELGLERFWDSPREAFNEILEPAGLTYEELAENGPVWTSQRYGKYIDEGFKTPSGKVEIYSEVLKKMVVPPIPEMVEHITSTEDYPLVMTSGKDSYYYHSSWRTLPSLRRISREPLVELCHETAEKYGLVDGEMAYIETTEGRITQRVKLNESLDPRIIYVAHAWWFPEREGLGWKESNDNMLTKWDGPKCQAMGAVTLRGIPCNVYPT
jgi:anaerobic selenocysteine-containing dehydrogenase